MDRRNFLRGIALGAVTAGATVALAPGAALAQGEEAPTTGGRYPGTVYTEGDVLRLTADRVTIVHPELGMTEVALSAKTSIWKGQHTTATAIGAGDQLSVRGYRLPDGSIDAVAIWANIAWRRGTVTAVSGSVVALHTGEASPDVFHVAGHTLLYHGDSPAQPFQGQLQAGHAVEALGSSERPGGVLVASRVWVD
jgi:hypothetical protein